MNSSLPPEVSDHNPSFQDPTNHPNYQIILKMVLWDEPKEKIDQKMRVNNISPPIAEQLYQHARADRIRTIRAVYRKRGLLGLLLLIVTSGALLYGTLMALGTKGNVIIVWYFPMIWGLWKFIDGTVGYLTAKKKTGSIADDF